MSLVNTETGEVVHSVALVVPRPHEVASATALCESIELALPHVDDAANLLDGRAKVLAIETYLAKTTKVGKARMEATVRRIEMRVGEVLGEAVPNGGNSRNGSGAPDPFRDIPLKRTQLSELRLLAAHRDVVERVIAESDDTKPPSQRKALDAIRDHLAASQKKEMSEMDARKAVAAFGLLGLTAQQIADETGLSHSYVCAVAKREGIALPGSQLAKQQRSSIIAELAAAGHDSTQIAQRLGLGAGYVRMEARRLGIEIPADAVMSGTRHLDSTRIVRASIESVDGIGTLFDQIDYAQLDPEDVKGWLPILETSIRSLTTLRNQLRKASQP